MMQIPISRARWNGTDESHLSYAVTRVFVSVTIISAPSTAAPWSAITPLHDMLDMIHIVPNKAER